MYGIGGHSTDSVWRKVETEDKTLAPKAAKQHSLGPIAELVVDIRYGTY